MLKTTSQAITKIESPSPALLSLAKNLLVTLDANKASLVISKEPTKQQEIWKETKAVISDEGLVEKLQGMNVDMIKVRSIVTLGRLGDVYKKTALSEQVK